MPPRSVSASPVIVRTNRSRSVPASGAAASPSATLTKADIYARAKDGQLSTADLSLVSRFHESDYTKLPLSSLRLAYQAHVGLEFGELIDQPTKHQPRLFAAALQAAGILPPTEKQVKLWRSNQGFAAYKGQAWDPEAEQPGNEGQTRARAEEDEIEEIDEHTRSRTRTPPKTKGKGKGNGKRARTPSPSSSEDEEDTRQSAHQKRVRLDLSHPPRSDAIRCLNEACGEWNGRLSLVTRQCGFCGYDMSTGGPMPVGSTAASSSSSSSSSIPQLPASRPFDPTTDPAGSSSSLYMPLSKELKDKLTSGQYAEIQKYMPQEQRTQPSELVRLHTAIDPDSTPGDESEGRGIRAYTDRPLQPKRPVTCEADLSEAVLGSIIPTLAEARSFPLLTAYTEHLLHANRIGRRHGFPVGLAYFEAIRRARTGSHAVYVGRFCPTTLALIMAQPQAVPSPFSSAGSFAPAPRPNPSRPNGQGEACRLHNYTPACKFGAACNRMHACSVCGDRSHKAMEAHPETVQANTQRHGSGQQAGRGRGARGNTGRQ